MSEPLAFYRPDFDKMYHDERQMFDCLVRYHRLVLVEPDPALYPDNADNECAKETRLKSAANYCVRPRGHEGMHLALTYWGAGIGGDE